MTIQLPRHLLILLILEDVLLPLIVLLHPRDTI